MTDCTDRGELILCAGHLDVFAPGAILNQRKTRFLVLTESTLYFYAHKKPNLAKALTKDLDEIKDYSDGEDETLDDSIFMDNFDSSSSSVINLPDESQNDQNNQNLVKSQKLIPSMYRVLRAIQTNNLSALGIPTYANDLKSSDGFKLIDQISLRNFIDIFPSIFDSINEFGDSCLEISYIDGGKKKKISLLPSSSDTFEYYPFTSHMFPGAILENWLISLRQANNMKPIQINSF